MKSIALEDGAGGEICSKPPSFLPVPSVTLLFLAYFLGFWESTLFLGPLYGDGQEILVEAEIAAAYLLVALSARVIVRQFTLRSFRISVVVVGAGGALMCFLSKMFLWSAMAIIFGGLFAVSFCVVSCFGMASVLFHQRSRSLSSIVCAYLITAIVRPVLSSSPSVVQLGILVTVLLFSCVLVAPYCRRLSRGGTSSDLPADYFPEGIFSLQHIYLFTMLLIFDFAFGFTLNAVSDGSEWSVVGSALLSSAIVVLCFVLDRLLTDSRILFVSAALLLMAALLLSLISVSPALAITSDASSQLCNLFFFCMVRRWLHAENEIALSFSTIVWGKAFSSWGIFLGIALDYAVSQNLVMAQVVFASVAFLFVAITLFLLGVFDFSGEKREAKDDPVKEAEPSSSANQTGPQLTSLVSSYSLTKREEEILALVISGQSNVQIQERLFISKNTVKFHLKNLYQKMGVHSREELASLFEEK